MPGPTFEELALKAVRTARDSCERLGAIGFRYISVADWLEIQIPRLRTGWRGLARAAIHELTRPGRPNSDGDGPEAE